MRAMSRRCVAGAGKGGRYLFALATAWVMPGPAQRSLVSTVLEQNFASLSG